MTGQASSTPARRLAVAAAGTRWANLSDGEKSQALDFIIDTFAVMAAGARPLVASGSAVALLDADLGTGRASVILTEIET